ncbi:hypothetical protein C1Y10_21360 [Pseudomonas sp. FW305-122]|nr:hypothetical protein C1Y10_21360 [Pseudomonas sp. FW305-122]
MHLWRGSLLPLGCEAAPIISVLVEDFASASHWCASPVGREQAPSPQKADIQRFDRSHAERGNDRSLHGITAC